MLGYTARRSVRFVCNGGIAVVPHAGDHGARNTAAIQTTTTVTLHHTFLGGACVASVCLMAMSSNDSQPLSNCRKLSAAASGALLTLL